jgi:hypothetical protein
MPIRASDFGAAQRENPAFAKFTNHVDSMTKFLLADRFDQPREIIKNASDMRVD